MWTWNKYYADFSFLFAMALFLTGISLGDSNSQFQIVACFAVGLLAAVWIFANRLIIGAHKKINWVGKWLNEQTEIVDQFKGKPLKALLITVVAVSLFVELMLIRWHGSAFQIFGFFKNITLLACFLGLGIGYALPKNAPQYIPFFVPLVAAQFFILHLLRFTKLQALLRNPISEHPTMGLLTARDLSSICLSYGFLLLVFIITAMTMIPIGQLAARLMLKANKLAAYSWNLFGSMAGVLLFTFTSYLWIPPQGWVILFALPILLWLRHPKTILVGSISMGLAIIILSAPFSLYSVDIYSPYQLITYKNKPSAQQHASLEVNNAYFQWITDLRDNAISSKAMAEEVFYYSFPYLLKPKPQRVLIVGSGSGNDAAVALRQGAQFIDAVEIDPAILKYGYLAHPEKPYSQPNVTTHLNDARNFIRTTKNHYDLIVYGLLDSHIMAANMSNLRLDSYVYTVEALREARARLTENGLLVLNFYLISDEQGKKISEMMKQAFDGEAPRVFMNPHPRRLSFVAGPYLHNSEIPQQFLPLEISQQLTSRSVTVDVSTDDWPFLYMVKRHYPLSYLVMNALLLLIGFLIIRRTLSTQKDWFNSTAFFLGAGFMLVETKAITELGLLFGSTWMTVSLVILMVLLMATIANLITQRRSRPWSNGSIILVGSLLVATLVLGYYTHIEFLKWLPPLAVNIIICILLTVPLFFSGLLFSDLLVGSRSVTELLAANIFGALFGGLLEYNSTYLGYRSLYLLAIVMYLIALLSSSRWKIGLKS
jgi:spermidine synthase